jgi:hypothetical protein
MRVAMFTHAQVWIVERWELKVKLPPPSMIDFRREVDVTSVNWEDQNAAAAASFALVSYKWHGIMYVNCSLMAFITVDLPLDFSVRCWDVIKLTVLWQLPMEDWYA